MLLRSLPDRKKRKRVDPGVGTREAIDIYIPFTHIYIYTYIYVYTFSVYVYVCMYVCRFDVRSQEQAEHGSAAHLVELLDGGYLVALRPAGARAARCASFRVLLLIERERERERVCVCLCAHAKT